MNSRLIEFSKCYSKYLFTVVKVVKIGSDLKKFCSFQFPSQMFKNRNGN